MTGMPVRSFSKEISGYRIARKCLQCERRNELGGSLCQNDMNLARFLLQFACDISRPICCDRCSDAEYNRHKGHMLFNVLNLLPYFFQFRFGLYDELRYFRIVGFRAEGIEFAPDLLAKKFQCASNRLVFLECIHELAKM